MTILPIFMYEIKYLTLLCKIEPIFEIMNASHCLYFKEICTAFEKRTGISLKYHPVFNLKREDYRDVPWPGNEHPIVYIISDRFGVPIHIGTSISIGIGIGNYLHTGPDGRCKVNEEKWGNAPEPHYLTVFEFSVENNQERKQLKRDLCSANDRLLFKHPEYITVRELFRQVTAERLCKVFPFLEGSASLERYSIKRDELLNLPSDNAADRYRLVVEPLYNFPNIGVAIGEVITMHDMLSEARFTLSDIVSRGVGFVCNLRVPMPSKMTDWQVVLALYTRLFEGKLNLED